MAKAIGADILTLMDYNLEAELARRSFIDFVQYMKPNYRVNWHHELIADYLDAFVRGEIPRLMIFTPPQHGKSELVSRNLPAYSLGNYPDFKIIGASYSATLANSFNRDAQRIMEQERYRHIFPETRISRTIGEADPAGKWKRTGDEVEIIGRGGFFKTVGVGGSLTGTPADIAIIDDPVKDAIEAMSSTTQQRNWDWYTDVLSTRLHNESRVLITQTRWDVNDLSGKILKQMEEGGEHFEILNLPAVRTTISHPRDPREVGEPLWPERHSIDKLLAVRKKSIRTYEALYQQNPKPVQAGGEFWKCFNPEKHVGTFRYLLGEPVHISLDNNVNPYVTAAVWQCKFNSNIKQIRQVHEIPSKHPNNNAVKAAMQMAKWLQANLHENIVYIYGDPSASARSTVDANNASFFDKYIEVLRQSGFKVVSRVKKSMPEIQLSANFINEIYEQSSFGFSLAIDSGCSISIEDYHTVKEEKDGKMQKIKRTDPTTGISYEPYGHFSDTKRYFLMTLLAAEFEKYKVKDSTYNVITQ